MLRWMDEAVERLAGLQWSCALDRADAGPAPMGELLELTQASAPVVHQLRRKAIEALAKAAKGSKGLGR